MPVLYSPSTASKFLGDLKRLYINKTGLDWILKPVKVEFSSIQGVRVTKLEQTFMGETLSLSMVGLGEISLEEKTSGRVLF